MGINSNTIRENKGQNKSEDQPNHIFQTLNFNELFWGCVQ